MPTRYSKILNESLKKQQQNITSGRFLKAEDKCGAISEARFLLVGTDMVLWLQIKIFVQMVP